MTSALAAISDQTLDLRHVLANVLPGHRERSALGERLCPIDQKHTGKFEQGSLIEVASCWSAPHHCADPISIIIENPEP
jgi:hypothetical protein